MLQKIAYFSLVLCLTWSTAWGLDIRSSAISPNSGMGINAKAYGVVGDGTTDDTTALQAAINAAINSTLYLPAGTYKYTTVLTIPSSVAIVGSGTGGNFATVLRPAGVQAFLISGVHHSTIQNVLIWPSGSATPNWITIDNSYSIILRDLRLHADISNLPASSAAIEQTASGGSSSNILYENVVVRDDYALTAFPIIYKFDSGCGLATLINPDFENANTGIQHDGGEITVISPYSERLAVYGVNLQASGDGISSFTMLGGRLGVANSAVPIAIKDGAKNVLIDGTYLFRPDGLSYQGYVYGLSGSSNIRISLSNFVADYWGNAVALDPSIIQFNSPMRSLPAAKLVSINRTAQTMLAGDITGAAFVELRSANATPGTQTTRTATQMVLDMKGLAGDAYKLRIANTGAGTLTLGAGAGVTLTGTMTIATATYRDFLVTLNSATTLTIQAIGTAAYVE